MKKLLLLVVCVFFTLTTFAQDLHISTVGRSEYHYNGKEWYIASQNQQLRSLFIVNSSMTTVTYRSGNVYEIYGVQGQWAYDNRNYRNQYIANIRGANIQYSIILDYGSSQIRVVNGYSSMVVYYITNRWTQ